MLILQSYLCLQLEINLTELEKHKHTSPPCVSGVDTVYCVLCIMIRLQITLKHFCLEMWVGIYTQELTQCILWCFLFQQFSRATLIYHRERQSGSKYWWNQPTASVTSLRAAIGCLFLTSLEGGKLSNKSSVTRTLSVLARPVLQLPQLIKSHFPVKASTLRTISSRGNIFP